MKKLTGKAALIMGSDSGIDQATARLFAQQGASVVVYHTDADGAERTRQAVEQADQQALVVQCDVSELQQAEQLFAQAVLTFGLGILVNDAGVSGAHQPVPEMAPADFEKALRTNLFGPFYLAQLFARHRQQHGGQPEEIAKVALFLASADADYVTGSTYVIDGGFMRLLEQAA